MAVILRGGAVPPGLHSPLELCWLNESPVRLSKQRLILQPKELHETLAYDADVGRSPPVHPEG